MIYGFIEKNTTRYSFRTVSVQEFDDNTEIQYGNRITQSYPVKAGLSRIFIDSGQEFDVQNFENIGSATFAAPNKKYIRALRSLVETSETFGQVKEYGALGTSKVNLVCIPGIFYGSKVEKGSVELNYYITGALAGTLRDTAKDGLLVQTHGNNKGSTAGYVLYNQGIIMLSGSWNLSVGGYVDNFFSDSATEFPTWLSFGTGIPTVGTPVTTGSVASSAYEIKFKGYNKIPTLTMMAHSEKNEENFSTNPTFLESSSVKSQSSERMYLAPRRRIKNINKSDFANHSASFESNTFITKVGIYDEDQNLIAVASLANPIKKRRERDYMIKMRMDF
tara:strand:- start:917 stop:1918 length:1002 start_codon:yes stop_codon:yes gene_type:complete